MSILFDNNASGTLSVQAEIVHTTLTLQTNEGQLFPAPGVGEFFLATLEDTSGNIEVVQCTDNTNDVLTVVRAQENTTAKVFPVGSKVELRTTAGTFDEFIQRSGGVMTGTLDMNGETLQDPVITTTGSGVIQGLAIRGSDNGTGNELVVPSAGADPTIGGSAIVTVANSTFVPTSRTLTGGEGIAAIGDLTTNRTVALDFTELANMSGSALAATDELPVYDADAGAHKTILYRQAGVPIINDATTNPVPTDDQVNAYWVCNNPATINFDVDTGIGEIGNVIIVEQGGAGVVDFTGGTATINSAYTNKQTQKQFSVAVLVCTANNTWTLYGDLT